MPSTSLPEISMALIVLRLVFLAVATGLGAYFGFELREEAASEPTSWSAPWQAFGMVMIIAGTVLAVDIFVPRKRLETVSAVYFGMLVGLFLTYALGLALSPLLGDLSPRLGSKVQLVMAVSLCYICISLLIQTKDDFRFIIPYVEFAKEVKGLKPLVLDTSVIIDGRIADVLETDSLDNQIVMPRFVVAELQKIADSSDKMRRTRGRRGLDVLNRLRGNERIDLLMYDRELPEFEGQPVDLKLVLLAKHLEGKVVTNDYNLNKVARVHGVQVVNLNDLANALKPVMLPGESVNVRIIKPGEEPRQGVGYLDDGTMIVVEGGRDHLNQVVRMTVTSMLQTSAGRMIFGRFQEVSDNDRGGNADR